MGDVCVCVCVPIGAMFARRGVVTGGGQGETAEESLIVGVVCGE